MCLASYLVYIAIMWVICKLVDAKTGGQIGPELKNAFKTVLPICQGCKSTKEPVTRRKYKHPTSSNSKASASKKARLSA